MLLLSKKNKVMERLMVRRKPRQTALALLLAFLIGQVSELLICEASNLMLAIAHLAVGGLCFLISTLVIIYNEPHIFGYLKSHLKKE